MTNPFWMGRRAIYLAIESMGSQLRGRVVDFGCGTLPYRKLLTGCSEYIGLDFDSSRTRKLGMADVYYDGKYIPMGDNSVDGLLSTQSLEHVPNPEQTVSEWVRILKEDGLVLTTVPLMWPEHETPWDFHRFTSYGLCNLLEKHGFEILEMRKLLPDCRALAELFLAWVHDVLFSRCGRLPQIFLIALICPPIVLMASLLAAVSPKNQNTYKISQCWRADAKS